ncbi:MAG: EpsG family protein [Fibrobacter intestinalis]|uniref:EpsG family protein n=1 Tax=Fibrobacter intestinalis TaxID=28122 RepID=UPI003F0BFA31
MILLYFPFLTLLLKLEKRQQLLCTFAVLFFLSAFRAHSVGNDTLQFCNAFYTITQTAVSNFNFMRYESGFIWLCQVLGYFSNSAQILIFTSSIFTAISFSYLFFKYSINVRLSLFLFICTTFIPTMNYMRQYLAIGVLLFTLPLILTERKEKIFARFKRFLPVIFLVWLASQFHNSAIFIGAFYLFAAKFQVKNLKRQFIFYSLLSILLFSSMSIINSFFVGKIAYLTYLENEKFGVSNYWGGCILAGLAFIPIILYTAALKNSPVPLNKMNSFLFHTLWFSFLFYLLAIQVQVFSRMAVYFSLFNALALPYTVHDKVFNSSYSRFRNKLILFVFASFYFVINTVLKPEWHGIVPYLFYCFGN